MTVVFHAHFCACIAATSPACISDQTVLAQEKLALPGDKRTESGCAGGWMLVLAPQGRFPTLAVSTSRYLTHIRYLEVKSQPI